MKHREQRTKEAQSVGEWDNFGIIAITMSTESPIPAMRAAGEVLFNCSILMRDGTWKHFDASQRGGGYAHADEGDGGYGPREAQAAWGGL